MTNLIETPKDCRTCEHNENNICQSLNGYYKLTIQEPVYCKEWEESQEVMFLKTAIHKEAMEGKYRGRKVFYG